MPPTDATLSGQKLGLLPFRSKKVGFRPYLVAFLVRTPPLPSPHKEGDELQKATHLAEIRLLF